MIAMGITWSPTHGNTAFAVPLFGPFMHRVMPGEDRRGGRLLPSTPRRYPLPG